jgi:hypothetical protein
MRLESPGGYHSVTSQLSRFGNRAEKPEAKWNLEGPDEMRRAASLEKANIRQSDTLEIAPQSRVRPKRTNVGIAIRHDQAIAERRIQIIV